MPTKLSRLATAVYLAGTSDDRNISLIIDVPSNQSNSEQDLTRKILQGVSVGEFRVPSGRYAVSIKRLVH